MNDEETFYQSGSTAQKFMGSQIYRGILEIKYGSEVELTTPPPFRPVHFLAGNAPMISKMTAPSTPPLQEKIDDESLSDGSNGDVVALKVPALHLNFHGLHALMAGVLPMDDRGLELLITASSRSVNGEGT